MVNVTFGYNNASIHHIRLVKICFRRSPDTVLLRDNNILWNSNLFFRLCNIKDNVTR